MGIPGLEMECLQSLPFQLECALKNVNTLCTWMIVFSSHDARPNVCSPHMNLLSFNPDQVRSDKLRPLFGLMFLGNYDVSSHYPHHSARSNTDQKCKSGFH